MMQPASNLSLTEMYFKHNISVSTADGEHRMNHPTIPGAVLVVSVNTLYNVNTIQRENRLRPSLNTTPVMPAATMAATAMAANVVGNNDPSINIIHSSIMGMNNMATNAMVKNNKRIALNDLQKRKNNWGRQFYKDNHTDETPLFINIDGSHKGYCSKCFNNIKNPILFESFYSHLSICEPVSPFYKQPKI
jgi:hypothetical protein